MTAENVLYIDYAEAVDLHFALMKLWGEIRYGVESRQLIESALARPKHAAVYENADIVRQAATLIFRFVKNHAVTVLEKFRIMKLHLLLILLITFSFCAFGQKKKMPVPSFKPKKTIEAIQSDIVSAKQRRDIWASYDKFDDKSTVYCKADSTLFFIFTFKGKTLSAQPKTFFIQADSTDSKDKFSYSTRLQFIADNDRIELKAVDYRLSGNIIELKKSVYFIATPQMLEKIANAKILDYRVGTFENNLINSERNKIKILLNLSTPY